MDLPMIPQDRTCRAGALDNPIRRWLAPARREVDRLGLAPGMVVADLGTGVGYFLPELAERVGPEGVVIAADVDEENLERARARPHPPCSLRFLQRSAADLPEVPDGSVDRVLLSLVICCLADKEGAMDEAWRVLRPGGKALVTYPRALGFGDRPGTLRVSRRRWRTLQLRRPWRALPVAAGIVVRRHLLEKPPTVAGGPQA